MREVERSIRGPLLRSLELITLAECIIYFYSDKQYCGDGWKR